MLGLRKHAEIEGTPGMCLVKQGDSLYGYWGSWQSQCVPFLTVVPLVSGQSGR